MSERDGFETRGRFYPWPQQFRLMDPLLVSEVTGMPYNQFLEAWQTTIANVEDGDTEANVDPVVLNGLVAVGVWQQHPEWRRERVVRFLEQVTTDDLDITSADEGEGDAVPPLNGESSSESRSGQSVSSVPSPPTLSVTSGSPSEQSTPRSTGTLASVTSSQG